MKNRRDLTPHFSGQPGRWNMKRAKREAQERSGPLQVLVRQKQADKNA